MKPKRTMSNITAAARYPARRAAAHLVRVAAESVVNGTGSARRPRSRLGRTSRRTPNDDGPRSDIGQRDGGCVVLADPEGNSFRLPAARVAGAVPSSRRSPAFLYVTEKQLTQDPTPLSGLITLTVRVPVVVPGEMVTFAMSLLELMNVVEFTVTPDPIRTTAPAL